MFNKIEEALEAFKLGNPILVVDDESRENEGDIIFAASFSPRVQVWAQNQWARIFKR